VPKISEAIKTDHFGLVSDFLSECWTRLRSQNRAALLQGRLTFGGALSGRDQNAVNKTISGLLKLIHPSPNEPVPDQDLEWAVRLSLECRRRVKEQQKRIGVAEFRNTQFSYTLGPDGVETFVVTPELQSEDQIGRDPLPPGQVWAMSPGGQDEGAGLYRIEVTEGPGSGVRILNRPAPGPFAESLKYAEQNLYARAEELVGDRNPREHEFSVQLRAFDTSKTGQSLGVAALLALCGSLIGKSLEGGLVVVGGLNLGGSIDPLYNAIGVVELAVEKGAAAVLIPVAARKQLFELSDDMAAKVNVLFYTDARDAFVKAVAD
jgi:ATP-dependent Lon protease